MCKDPLEHLKQFEKNQKWYWSHFKQLLKKYHEKFVAISRESLAGDDKDIVKLRDKLESEGVDLNSTYVEYVTDQPLDLIL
ncbi:MAG: hypothetical protein ABIH68_05045 [bacterium]